MSETAFETFWKAYPRRIGKGHARKAFERAIKLTTLETMLEAITAYITHKPPRIDYKHPTTWLNGECWADEWQSVPALLPTDRQQRPSLAGMIDAMQGGSYDRSRNH